MGELNVNQYQTKEDLKVFKQHLFRDIRALEMLIEQGMIESGITRIGAEQELALVDQSYLPASIAPAVLDAVKEVPHFTNELATFNIEINLDPQEFTGNCLSTMENQLLGHLDYLGKKLKGFNADYAMAGILPTISKKHLSLDHLTPIPRYFALNDAILEARGGDHYEFRIAGTDELITRHDTLMMESCNTSFQIHYQVSAEDFASKHNWAQTIAAPVMSVATYSPLLFGYRLWRETRIALFQQSADTRRNLGANRQMAGRVFFGDSWCKGSVMDIYREEIARHRVLLSRDIEEDAIEALQAGRVPKLQALKMHSGTIYPWNRACYGSNDKVPHLRIENRYIPAGPTVLDEIANMTFWLGLMHGQPDEYKNIHEKVDFDLVKGNFNRAAKVGLGMMVRWVDDKIYTAQDLVLKELLPMAEEGLKKAKIDQADIDRYLGVIRERVTTGKTGSQWMLDSFEHLKSKGTKEEALVAIMAGITKRQKTNKPVHSWTLAKSEEAGSWVNRFGRISQIMSHDLYTVQEDDLVDLLPNIMVWKELDVLLVENVDGEYVGMVTSSQLLNHYATRLTDKTDITVKEIMITGGPTVTEDTSTVQAIHLIRQHNLSCLPVVGDGNCLVGIVTERHFVNVADNFLREFVNSQEAQKRKRKIK